jgi:hypothetical protein
VLRALAPCWLHAGGKLGQVQTLLFWKDEFSRAAFKEFYEWSSSTTRRCSWILAALSFMSDFLRPQAEAAWIEWSATSQISCF